MAKRAGKMFCPGCMEVTRSTTKGSPTGAVYCSRCGALKKQGVLKRGTSYGFGAWFK